MIVFARDRTTGRVIALDTLADCYKQIGKDLVLRERKSMVAHHNTCRTIDESPSLPHFSERHEGDL